MTPPVTVAPETVVVPTITTPVTLELKLPYSAFTVVPVPGQLTR